jgi:hypothetical protein
MSDLATLAQDIAEAEATAQTRLFGARMNPFHMPPVMPAVPSNRVVALLGVEILQTAALIAVVSSVFNALERRSFGQLDERAVRAFVPAHSDAFVAAATDVAEGACNLSQLLALKSYLARFNLAVRLTQSALGPRGEMRHALNDDVEMIADAWRRTCVAALEAEAALCACNADNDVLVSLAERSRGRELLELAAMGGWPCLTVDGRVTVPGWAERRRSVRVAVSQLVTVVAHGAASAGRLIDVSRDGMQIATAVVVERGDAIDVVLADQRRIAGVVRWAQDGRIGLQFTQTFNF